MKHFLAAALLLFTTTLSAGSIPQKIVDFSHDRVFLIAADVAGKTGTAFVLSNSLAITACHVVDNISDDNTLHLVNLRDTRMIFVKVVHCDQERDIAVLRITGGDPLDVKPILVQDKMPRIGTEVFGAGHPQSMPLVITQGHIQEHIAPKAGTIEPGIMITAPTIGGDSGSPVLIVNDEGEVEIVGIRLAIRQKPASSFGPYPMFESLTHLVYAGTGKQIAQTIKDGLRKEAGI